MTKSIFHFCLLLLFASLPFQAFSQSGEQNGNNSKFSNQFQSTLGGYYYQDAISVIAEGRVTLVDGVVDKNYILGPNDIISISINANEKYIIRALLINAQGQVVIPQIGTISLEGKSIYEADSIITEKASEVLITPSVTITLEFAKFNTVHISGGLPYPGKFELEPFTRVDEALYGAVFDTYEVNSDQPRPKIKSSNLLNRTDFTTRNIIIEHRDGSVSHADLYAYFKAGHLEKNPIIRDGDKISAKSLSRKNPKVGISGSVQKSMEIEYSPNDTPRLLVDIAGGFAPDADTSRVFVFRRGEKQPEKIVVTTDEFKSFKVLPYDRIVVPQAEEDLHFASAWVFGEAKTPGNYPIKSGETTALELLELSGNLTKRALTSGAYLLRSGSIENEIPDKFNIDLMKRTSDQIAQGLDYLELETTLSQDKVFIDLNDKEQLEKVIIYNGDRIYIPRDEKTIFVFGQINNPGYYPYTNSDVSVSEYIDRAGGFALSADQDRIFVIKAGSGTWFKPKETTIESGDRIFIDRIPYDELNAQRTYEVQKEQIKNTRIQLIMTGISTITGIITTYVAIQNIRN